MKKIITSGLFIILMLSAVITIAQTTRPFELGFNAGASWQKSDIAMKKLGGGGGFTFGRMYLENDKSIFDIGWRFRYLNAVQYGQGNEKSTGIANNVVLNGTTDTVLNYNSNGGFVYQNYKTTLNECSLELVIGLNQMRNKTKFYPYVFGGLGITKAVTKTNQLNDNNQRYNYAKVDSLSTAGVGSVSSNLNNLYDGSYETTAEGSRNPSWKFMPSLGIGLGYQATKVVSIGLEYKVTWALSDQLDGQQWSNDNTRSLTNDKYYYASAWLKFSFGRKVKPVPTTTTNTTTTNTDPNTFTNNGDKPSIVMINPGVSPFTSAQKNYIVQATITNVNSKSDISLIANGVNSSNFTYDAFSHAFSFPTELLNGNNSFMITAQNIAGNTIATATVIFDEPIVVSSPTPAPVITITNPISNPFTTTFGTASVNAIVLNVTSQSEISVLVNGAAISGFVFNPSTHGLNINNNLLAGANSIIITATNSSGRDSKSITIIYNKAVQSPPPVITITSPSINPYTSANNITDVVSEIRNVTALGQISVTVNGTPVPTGKLFFNTSSGQLNFNANLITGANTIVISATNIYGADSKTETIIYSPQVVVQKPVITITSPTISPFNTTNNSAIVDASVLNISAASQIVVSINGSPSFAFTFNAATKQLSLSTGLIFGANLITITATNSAGTDSKSQTIIYSQPVTALPAPVITITLPTLNPFNTSVNTSAINATILNVVSASQISVTLNGSATAAFTFNSATKLFSFPVNLITGANLIAIKATNASGVDTKSQTIIYSQPATVLAPVIAITSPASNPFNTTSHTAIVKASVLNVTAASQISITANGTPITAFAFNPSTHVLGTSVNLIGGTNSVIITATNSAGADTKSETIIYEQPVVVVPPIVTITSPTANPFNSSSNTSVVNATVLNVTTPSQVAVIINGTPITGFAFNPSAHTVGIPVSLIAGANTITITATNSGGADTKSQTIIYTKPVIIVPAPIVTITSPSTSIYTCNLDSYNVEATVLNVASSSEISVKVNGVTLSTFSYSLGTKKVMFTVIMPGGPKTVIVSATNAGGTDSKTATINFVRSTGALHPDTLAKPVGQTTVATTGPMGHRGGPSSDAGKATIVFALPNPYSTTTATISSSAVVDGVLNQTSIVVKMNAVIIPFTYNSHTKAISFTANLNVGINALSVEATNAVGVKTETLTITRH